MVRPTNADVVVRSRQKGEKVYNSVEAQLERVGKKAAQLGLIAGAAAVGGGPKFEERYKGDEDVPTVELLRRPVHFSYVDGDDHVFMDDEDFSQYPLKAEDIRDELPFITEGCDGLLALKVGDSVIGLELPLSVVLTITETTPAMKAASASARTKPATLETGLVVQVPEYIQEGEKVKVNTSERKFMSRA